jgi:hypothetical protein
MKGGGHGVAGKAVCDGGLIIDPSRTKSIRVDPAWRVKPDGQDGDRVFSPRPAIQPDYPVRLNRPIR